MERSPEVRAMHEITPIDLSQERFEAETMEILEIALDLIRESGLQDKFNARLLEAAERRGE